MAPGKRKLASHRKREGSPTPSSKRRRVEVIDLTLDVTSQSNYLIERKISWTAEGKHSQCIQTPMTTLSSLTDAVSAQPRVNGAREWPSHGPWSFSQSRSLGNFSIQEGWLSRENPRPNGESVEYINFYETLNSMQMDNFLRSLSIEQEGDLDMDLDQLLELEEHGYVWNNIHKSFESLQCLRF